MKGILTFPSLQAAMNAGFHVYDRSAEGYLVRTRTRNGLCLAIALVAKA